MALGLCCSHLKSMIFKFIILNSSLGTHCIIGPRWMPQNRTKGKSILVQVLAWCHQATSHYLSQCWPRSILPYGIIRLQWIKTLQHMLTHGLTHWGRVTHIWINKLTIIGSINGLSPGRRQAIIWTNAGILLIGPLGTNFSEILIEI